MRGSLLHSLLELANATSENLGFAHQNDVHVSYGEETITETNLLELRRRHPKIITLNTFSKHKEARNGADWEWHIIGRHRQFQMRVQAKRLQRDDKLVIPRKVKSSQNQQIELLIADAKVNGLRPVYCIYSAENQRSHWAAPPPKDGLVDFEYGCLLASAYIVQAKMPKTLGDIEKDCVPWHYLVERRCYLGTKIADVLGVNGSVFRYLIAPGGFLSAEDDFRATDSAASKGFPTIDELNAVTRPAREIEGLIEATDPKYAQRRSDEEYIERGISRLVEIDVSELPAGIPDTGDKDE